MGLDMYLHRVKKVKGFTPNDFHTVDNALFGPHYRGDLKITMLAVMEQYPGEIKISDEAMENIHELNEEVHVENPDYDWKSIMYKVGYWRKANAIHKWFVDKVQEGIDRCESYVVSKEKLQDLLHDCNQIKDNKKLAKKMIPSAQGFFFGGTDYDEWYWQSIDNTIEIVTKILTETNFDEDQIMYHSSW